MHPFEPVGLALTLSRFTAWSGAHQDSFPLRRTALECRVPYFTTIAGAAAAAAGIEYLQQGALGVRSLQEYHAAQLSG